MSRATILQPNYIPWKGYFDFIDSVDVLILLDTDQYTPCNWRNRNRIKTRDGSRWLTIPVRHKGFNARPRIHETQPLDAGWAGRHLKRLLDVYREAPAFAEARPFVEELYSSVPAGPLGAINRHLIGLLCDYLKIRTAVHLASTMEDPGGRIERLISLCRQAGATHYLSAPNAAGYLEPHTERFLNAGIEVSYFRYPPYPEYPQVHPPFDHQVTILDPVFHAAEDCARLTLSREFDPEKAAGTPGRSH